MESSRSVDIGDDEVATAIESLRIASFASRHVRSDWQAATPEWKIEGGLPLHDHVRDRSDRFKRDVEAFEVRDVHGSAFHRVVGSTRMIVESHRLLDPIVPTPRDLFNVYGPDRDDSKDWRRYYRYAWKDEGPHASVYSTDAQAIRQGKLACNSYAYSGQSSFALVGTGLFYCPEFGDAKISIRPYVQWQTSASFTGTESTPATATARIGIFVQSRTRSSSQGHYVDRDHWVTVFSQNTQGYRTGVTAGGAVSVVDGLATEVLAVAQRTYNIFIYAELETTAAPQQQRNELRFVTVDVDATVPFVVVEETLV